MTFIQELFQNKIIGISILSWAVAQLIKIIIDLYTTKKIDLNLIMSSGGMPSSHSSFVTSLAISTGIIYGFNSVYFSITFCLAIVVMYDAAGVRRAAGKQAATLNNLLDRLDIQVDERLKELLGHSPVEVTAGAILGIVIAVIAIWLLENEGLQCIWKVNYPEDLKKLDLKNTYIVWMKSGNFLLMRFLTGDTFLSNLGVVELTVALHYCFNCPKDKIVWDVGHQSYTQNTTGRK